MSLFRNHFEHLLCLFRSCSTLPSEKNSDFFIKKTLLETGEKGRLSIKGEVLNIFDEEYSTIYGYPMPGRSFFVGLRYDF